MNLAAPPTSASPEDHTEMEKKVIAVSRERKDPTIRPCTPKCAEDETALLVPLAGPNSAMGASRRAPATRPSRVAATPCQNERPKRMGKAPSTQVAKVLAPPKASRNRSNGRAVRSASGIRSTPYVSISVIRCEPATIFFHGETVYGVSMGKSPPGPRNTTIGT